MIPFFEVYSINLGFISINAWGLMVALGFLISIILGYREAKRQGLKGERILDLAILIIISAIIGARMFYVLNEWDQYQNHPIDILKFWEGGLAIYGGFIGAIIAGWIYLKIKKENFWQYADIIFYILPLGLAIGRIGCFLIHDHLGRITVFPLGIKMPEGEIRHETAFYEILFCLALFCLFIVLKRKGYLQSKSGYLGAFFLIGYGAFRFFSDFLRAIDLPGSDPVIWLGFHPSQFFSLGAILIGIWILIYIKRKSSIKA